MSTRPHASPSLTLRRTAAGGASKGLVGLLAGREQIGRLSLILMDPSRLPRLPAGVAPQGEGVARSQVQTP
jgi:hypothetical protein